MAYQPTFGYRRVFALMTKSMAMVIVILSFVAHSSIHHGAPDLAAQADGSADC